MAYERHPAMPVRIVPEGRGHGPEPVFDPAWSDLEKLQWRAGCIIAHCGDDVRIEITTGGSTIAGVEIPDRYGLNIGTRHGFTGIGSASFRYVWHLLSGFELGWEAAGGAHV